MVIRNTDQKVDQKKWTHGWAIIDWDRPENNLYNAYWDEEAKKWKEESLNGRSTSTSLTRNSKRS